MNNIPLRKSVSKKEQARLKKNLDGYINEIIKYYKDTGQRPDPKFSKKFYIINLNLKREHGNYTIAQLCDLLNIKKSPTYTMSYCKKALMSFYKVIGETPRANSYPLFNQINNYLRTNHNSSIVKLSIELGIYDNASSIYSDRVKRTLDSCIKEIQNYYNETGFRPIERQSKEFVCIDSYLRRNHKLSIAKVCNQLNIPRKYKKLEK